MGNAALTINLAKNLDLRIRSGMDSYHDLRKSKRAFSTQRFKNGAYREDEVDFSELNTDAFLAYSKEITTKLNFNAGLGANNFTQKTRYSSSTANQLSVPGIYSFENAKVPLKASQFTSQKQINSIYGVAGFNYNKFLYLDLTVRNDWSTTLPKGNNSFAYYSTTLAFILSEVITLPSWFSYAKLRAGISSVGGDTKAFQLNNTFQFSQNYGSFPLLTNSSTLQNADLRPERINGLEFGTELYFFKDRLGLDVTVYQNTAKDQIISLPASGASGYTNQVVNGGVIQSKGIEITLKPEFIRKENFSWTSLINFSAGASYVKELPEGIDQYTTGFASVYNSFDNTVYYISSADGGRMGDMYGTGFKKTADGQIIYNANGLPIRDSKLRKLGNYNPDFVVGIGNQFKFKNISLGVLIDWRQGGTIVSRQKAIGHTSGVLLETLEGREEGIIGDGVVNVGTEANPVYEQNTKVISAADYYNQFYNRANEESSLYSASYVKIRQISLSFTMPEKWISQWKIQELKIGLIATNLFTFTENPHFDPELSAMQGTKTVYGVEDFSYPSSRSYGMNVQIKF